MTRINCYIELKKSTYQNKTFHAFSEKVINYLRKKEADIRHRTNYSWNSAFSREKFSV